MEAHGQTDPQPVMAASPPQPEPVDPQPVPEPEEVSFDQAKAEQAPSEPQKQEKPEDVLDILVPKSEPRVWQIGPRQYVQKELSFLQKMQWFALVGDVMDKALSGPNGMSLNSLFESPARGGTMTLADFRDADMFVQAIGKLVAVAPKFLVDSYCIWLNVPDYEKDLVAEQMAQSPAEGGLSDEQGIEIIEVFIDQNYAALDRFFRELVARLQRRVQNQMETASKAR